MIGPPLDARSLAETIVICARCAKRQTIKSASRLPKGWKRLPAPTCAACLRAAYVQRAVVVPIAFPLGSTWADFGAALKAQWVETTRAANDFVSRLYAADVRRQAMDTKLRPMPTRYWYPELRRQFPAIAPINLTSLIQSVEQTYRAQRYELLWTGQRSLATFRYPVPTPLHAQGWTLRRDPDGRYIVRAYLGDTWWELSLRGGPTLYAQRQRLDQILDGTALPAAGAIYRHVARSTDHHGALDAGRTRVLVKLVGWFPKAVPRATKGVLTIRTSASDLLRGSLPFRPDAWTCHGDHLRRAIGQYETERRRVAEDLSVLRRWVPAERAALLQRLETIKRRQARRMRTWSQQIGAAVVRAARQAGVATVQYEDEEEGFCRPFPWTAFRLAIQSAVEAAGLTWQYASGDRTTEIVDPARDTDNRVTMQ